MKFQSTTKYRISKILVLAILLQIFIPVMGDVIWADEVNVVDNIEISKEGSESGYRPGIG